MIRKLYYYQFMKHLLQLITLLFAIVTIVGTVLAGVLRANYPQASHRNGNIVVTWATEDESNVREFRVLRKSGMDGEFVELRNSIVAAKGTPSVYEYQDTEAFKTSVGIYFYQVRIVFNDGSYAHSAIAPISPPASAAKRTWGSIKAMFR